MMWNKELNAFFVQGRHVACTVLITTQHTKGVGPLIRGNMDFIVIQPTFQHQARIDLQEMYGGFMHKEYFFDLMDNVVTDENLPGSTPQEPLKRVRVLCVRDFENTRNAQIKYQWWEASDPGKFRMLDPAYWKEQDNDLGSTSASNLFKIDPCDELDKASVLAKVNLY